MSKADIKTTDVESKVNVNPDEFPDHVVDNDATDVGPGVLEPVGSVAVTTTLPVTADDGNTECNNIAIIGSNNENNDTIVHGKGKKKLKRKSAGDSDHFRKKVGLWLSYGFIM